MNQEIVTEIYDSRIDSFSAGTMIYQLIKGGVPEFFLRNGAKIDWANGDSKYEIKPLNPKNWSKEINDFLMILMHKDSKQRPLSKEVLEVPFL